MTFTFSEAPSNFDASDLTVVGGAISGLAATADPKAWTATFAATDNYAGTGSVTVGNAWTDTAGNAGVGNADTVTIDTTGDLVYADQTTYYEIWEQEYAVGGPPFPSPTPYALVGTSFTFGQRIELWPMHVMVTARAAGVISEPGIAPNSQQLYLIEITWYNQCA